MPSLHDISREEIQAIANQLEQALYNHQQWFNDLTRTLVCRLPPDRHDISPQAHRECRFGQWYYEHAHQAARGHPGFVAIGTEHAHMHRQAARLLNAERDGKPITATDYNYFTNALDRMRLEIFSFRHELEELLYDHDPLTRALSRVSMLPILREQQELLRRHAQPCCIAMMDLDLFKQVNDQHGHLAGDRVLAATAHYVMESLRPYDKVFRYGGEEFLICMQHTELPVGLDLVERLRAGLAVVDIEIGGDQTVRVTASFGVTAIDTAVPIEEVLDRVDKALYTAKSAGRNCVRRWMAGM